MDEVNITLDTLSDSQREIAELIGLDNYVKLVNYYSGSTAYIQTVNKMSKPSRNMNIIQDAQFLSIKELSQKYRLGVRQIHNIVPRDLKNRVRNDNHQK